MNSQARWAMARHQLGRFDLLFDKGSPPKLWGLLAYVRQAIEAVGREGAPSQPHHRQFDVLGETWTVSKFADSGVAWVGIEWPDGTDQALISWLRKAARRHGLSSRRRTIPENQIWISLGAI